MEELAIQRNRTTMAKEIVPGTLSLIPPRVEWTGILDRSPARSPRSPFMDSTAAALDQVHWSFLAG